jgi:hypothetical protein
MFIGWVCPINPPPFGGAELNLPGTHPVTFRPSERRNSLFRAQGYKHLTPTEWSLFCCSTRIPFGGGPGRAV